MSTKQLIQRGWLSAAVVLLGLLSAAGAPAGLTNDKCLECHAGTTRSDGSPAQPRRASPSETSRPTPCPVNPTTGCIACHMPAVKNVVPHTFFTDHFIRVHRD